MRLPQLIAFALMTLPRLAQPCSLAFGPANPELPPESAVVGPSPVLLLEGRNLFDNSGNALAVEPLTDGPLVGLVGALEEPLELVRPRAPLAAGEYRLAFSDGSGERRFTVADNLVSITPAVVEVDLRFVVERPIDDGGVGCVGGSSCDGVTITRLEVIPRPAGAAGYLITLSSASGEGSRLVAAPSFSDNIDFGFLREIGVFGQEEICVSVTPVAGDGTLGSATNAGCIDPNDDKDSRVEDHRGGCSAAGGSLRLEQLLALGALGMLVVRDRRHRRKLVERRL